MLTAVILSQVILFIFSVRKYNVASPATIICAFTLISTIQMIVANQTVSRVWYTHIGLGPNAVKSAGVFTILSICVVAVSFSRARFDGVHASTLRRSIRAFFQQVVNKYSQFLTPIIFALTFWHFIQADFSRSWSYTDYMSSRFPSFYSLDDPISLAAHKLLKFFGLYSAALLPLLNRKKLLQIASNAFIFIYVLIFHLILGSKYVGLEIGLCSLSVFISRTNVRSLIFATFLMLTAGWLVLVNFSVRSSRLYGLSSFWKHVFSFEGVDKTELLSAYHLLFGGINLLNASQNRTFYFSDVYKALSFSPLFSILDGYDRYATFNAGNTLQYWSTLNGDVWVPLSGFGEAMAFGWPYLIFLFFIICASARAIQIVLNRYGGYVGGIPLACFVMGFMIITMYPIRNGLRLIFLSWIISILFQYFSGKSFSSSRHS